jgi:uncharacterized protein (DUF952 family)
MLIYKILTKDQWHSFQATGVFTGAPIDVKDGYIHFSTMSQVRETAAKHFAGLTDLWLIAVAAESLGDELKWEVSRGGAQFPHLYAHLAMNDVSQATTLPFFYGRHMFGSEIP